MRILLDECIPCKLKNEFLDHECQTVPEVGLAGKKNGELLSLAAPHAAAQVAVHGVEVLGVERGEARPLVRRPHPGAPVPSTPHVSTVPDASRLFTLALPSGAG